MNRRQASLYLPESPIIESLRIQYNPLQAQLIPAHVTLCREDEVADWDIFRARLETLCPFEITLDFGLPIREDDFVFLPVREGFKEFHEFRRALLENEPRRSTPHLTLIHPRNGNCTDVIFADILQKVLPFQCIFREVMLIEQANTGVWKTVARVGGVTFDS